MKHDTKPGFIVFPNHGSQEVGKGLENKVLKDAGLKQQWLKRGNEHENNNKKN